MSEEKRLQKVLSSGDKHLINIFFSEIYNQYKGLVCFVIAKYIKNREDVFDIAQDVFLSFFNNAHNINSNIKYYLTTSAKNKALNHLKKYNKISLVDDFELDTLDDKDNLNNDVFNDTLALLKENLKSQEYELLLLHLFDNYTFKEISTKLNIKESTLKTLYYRTIKKSRLIIERSKDNG